METATQQPEDGPPRAEQQGQARKKGQAAQFLSHPTGCSGVGESVSMTGSQALPVGNQHRNCSHVGTFKHKLPHHNFSQEFHASCTHTNAEKEILLCVDDDHDECDEGACVSSFQKIALGPAPSPVVASHGGGGSENVQEGHTQPQLHVGGEGEGLEVQKKALDLFSGTHSVGKKLQEMGYQVVSVDINKRSRPDFPVDIMQWEYWKVFAPGHFDLVAASVPCNEYSQAKKVGIRDMESADKLVKKTLEIIEYLRPQKWWIENPRNGYLRTRGILDKYPYVDLDYCQLSDWGYNKPTRFWGSPNVVSRPSLRCDFQTCPNLEMGPHGKKGIVFV